MKKILFILLMLAVTGLLVAQNYTRNTPRIRRIFISVVYNAAGTVASVPTTAVFRGWEVNTVNTADFQDADNEQVAVIEKNYNAIVSPATTVTTSVGGGVTITRAQLYDLVRVDAISRP